MIVAMLRDLLAWFAGLTEVVLVVAAILLVGLTVGMTGFWILVHGLSRLDGSPAEPDPSEDDLTEEMNEQAVSPEPDDDPSPFEIRR